MVYRRFVPDQPYELRQKGDLRPFASVSGAQLDDLLDHLVREHARDRDYYIDRNTLQFLRDRNADEALLNAFELRVGAADGIEIEWAATERSETKG